VSLPTRLWFLLFPLLTGLIGLATAVAATTNHESNPVAFAIVFPLIAFSFVVSGLIAWTLRPENGTGRLLVLTGFLWTLESFYLSNNGWVLGFAELFGSLYLAAFLHLLLAFPEGRLSTRLERWLIGGLWATAFLAGALPAVFSRKISGCDKCPQNQVVLADHQQLSDVLQGLFTVAGGVIFLGVVGLLIHRWRHATRAQRRILGPVYLSGGVTVALVAVLFTVGSFSNTAGTVFGIAAFTAFGLVPLFFLAGLLRTRLYRAAARLLQEVPDDPTDEQIQTGLRSVLGDPTLVFLTWNEEAGSYVDAGGKRCRIEPQPGRAVTRIGYEDLKLGALVHDTALLHQQALLDEVVSAARIAMMKDRGRRQLRRSQARSRALLDAIPDLMFRMARDGTYLEAEGRRESLIRPREELIGRTVNELLPEDIADKFTEAMSRPASEGVQTIEYRLDIGGELRDFEARMVPSGDDEVVVIVRDFTEQRMLQDEVARRFEEVQREQEFTRAVVNAAPVILLLVDTDGGIIRFNDTTEELFGVPDDESVRGKPWWDEFLPEENREGARIFCRRMNEGADGFEAEADWITRDGRRLAIKASVLRVVDGEGKTRYLICGQDLTELVRQRDEIEAQRDFLSAVGRATPSLLVSVSSEGRVDAHGVNYAFRELTGYTDEDVIGRPFWELVAPPELVGEMREAFEEQVESGISVEHETAWIGRSGSWRIVSWWLRQLGESGDKYVVCGTDITEAKAQEAELRASRSRIVEAGDDARRRLERNLHDGAQQRLVSLSLALRLAQAKLRDDPDGAEQLLSGAGEELNYALAELRELARGIHPAVLTDRGLSAALEALAARAPLPVELDTELEERLPGPVEAAAYYVVSEALTNVAKYAEASAVQVRAERQNGKVLVEVVDDGIGGADPSRGSGLRGLADRLAALDGSLEVESATGSGTTVRAVIPLSPA
jgi:PAS domain S-box-containing protein